MRFRTVVVVLLSGFMAAPALAAPAFAHAGAAAQLYVASADVVAEGQGWRFRAVLRDLDSGAPEPGFAVSVAGSGPRGAAFGPLSMADPRTDGRYEATLPATEGSWSLTLSAEEAPGGEPALPLRKTWTVALAAGRSFQVGKAGSGGSGGSGGSALPMVGAVVGAVAVLGGTLFFLGRRRRGDVVPVR